VHGAGLRVYTTLDLDLQRWRTRRCWTGRRRMSGGMGGRESAERGAEGKDLETYKHPDWAQAD
jgi:penicillin-binding protein 1A